MKELSPEDTIRAFWAALNAHDFGRAASAIAEDCHWESVAAETRHYGPTDIVNGLGDAAAAFPDWRGEIVSLYAAGSVVIVEWRTSGTFTNAFRGREPNGKRFERRGCSVAEVSGGRIRRYRDYYDRATMLSQLDLLDLLPR